MANKYLDNTGLSYLLGKIKNDFAYKTEASQERIIFNAKVYWFFDTFGNLRIRIPASYFRIYKKSGSYIQKSISQTDLTITNARALVYNSATNTFSVVNTTTTLNLGTDEHLCLVRWNYMITYWALQLNEQHYYDFGNPFYAATDRGGINAENIFTLNHSWSDFCFVGDKLWVFIESGDNHLTNDGHIYIYSLDYETNTATLINHLTHNLGHCNTVSYCEQTDTLILGNGGNASNTENNQIYIIQNLSSFESATQLTLSSAIIIDLVALGLNWGMKVNVCWGESNYGRYDIAYVVSENGSSTVETTTKYIKQIQLGKGSNNLTYGTALSADSDEFNGTFSIIKEYTTPMNNVIVNQGMEYFNGKLYEAVGHTGLWLSIMSFNYLATEPNRKFIQERYYDATGTEQSTINSEGLTIHDGKIYMGAINNSLVGYKILVGKIDNL